MVARTLCSLPCQMAGTALGSHDGSMWRSGELLSLWFWLLSTCSSNFLTMTNSSKQSGSLQTLVLFSFLGCEILYLYYWMWCLVFFSFLPILWWGRHRISRVWKVRVKLIGGTKKSNSWIGRRICSVKLGLQIWFSRRQTLRHSAGLSFP